MHIVGHTCYLFKTLSSPFKKQHSLLQILVFFKIMKFGKKKPPILDINQNDHSIILNKSFLTQLIQLVIFFFLAKW